jgi:hypothetical protein
MTRYVICLLLCGLLSLPATADDPGPRATYIANMGAMIERGDTRIVFDPLFHYEHDTYQRVPAEIEAALLSGAEPWNSIDAVFISHHHGDHFDPAMILKLLRAHPAIELFGPEQAAAAIRELVPDPEDPLLHRVHGLSLENGMAATDINFGPLLVEAIRIRHAGWPDYNADVENIVFRVTLDNETTVMHFAQKVRSTGRSGTRTLRCRPTGSSCRAKAGASCMIELAPTTRSACTFQRKCPPTVRVATGIYRMSTCL